MDILQREMENNESFVFEIGKYKFFEKDDNGYYTFATMVENDKGFDMHYRKDYQEIINMLSIDGYEHYEHILNQLERKLTYDFDKLFKDNAGQRPNSLLVAVTNYADNIGQTLLIGDNDTWAMLPQEERLYALKLSEKFEEVLSLLNAKLVPSFEEINQTIYDNGSDYPVKIVTSKFTYSTNAFVTHLNKIHGIWIDVNNVKKEDAENGENL